MMTNLLTTLVDRIEALFNRLHWPIRRTLSGPYDGQRIVVDYVRFRNARVTNCTLVYHGGTLKIDNSHLEGCSWVFGGKAGATVELLQLCDSKSNTVIEELFPYSKGKARREW